MIEGECEAALAKADSNGQLSQFSELFGSILTKPLSKKWLTKEKGYNNMSRFYEQRLFN